ncbi:YceI family protein [Xanthobacteraceae bacterium A53D]
MTQRRSLGDAFVTTQDDSMRLAPLAAFALAVTLAAPVHAQTDDTTDPKQVKAGTYAIDGAHSRATWSVSHLGYSTFTGILPAAEGTLTLDPAAPDKSQVEVTFKVEDIVSVDRDLDAHLKQGDFFNAAKFPTVTFKSTAVVPDGNKARVTGDLTLLGVTRPVTLDVTFNKAGESPVDKLYRVGFDATGTLKRSEFGMKALLPAIPDDVKLQISGEFTQK